jgi:hypothetical protein
MPPRLFRAEQNHVRIGRAEFTLSQSSADIPGMGVEPAGREPGSQ